MSEEEKGGLVPRLRFPGFRGAENWKIYYGKEIFSQASNKNHNSDYPILAITQEHGAIPRELINYHVSVMEKSIENYKLVEVGDFIISLRSFQGGIEYSEYKGICSPAYVILKLNLNYSKEYFKHFFKWEQFIVQINKNIEGLRDGKMVSYKQFSALRLPVPPCMEEQQKIADCLSSLDNLIEAQSQKLELLKSHKKALMQQLFPNVRGGGVNPWLRFPEFREAGEWQYVPLSEISEPVTERVGNRELIPISISAGFGFVAQANKFGRNISGKQYKLYTIVRDGDFVYNKGNSIKFPQGCIYDLQEWGEVAAPNVFICFRLKAGYENGFYRQCFEKNLHGEQLKKYITSGARNNGLLNINKNAFWNILIPVPEQKEQQKIAHCLSSLDELMETQSQKLKHFQTHKKSLMQRLFPVLQK